MRYRIISIIMICWALSLNAQETKLRIGVLAYGTVNWGLDVIKYHKLDKKYGFDLEVVKLASKNATTVSFQAKDVDIIVNDWVWVNTQRANGKDFTFYPYSKTIGTILTNPKSNIEDLTDLSGKELGLVGGKYDKTWLLFRAYYKKVYKKDLQNIVKPVFASPPIIYKKMLDNSLNVAINFWNFNAKLKAKGMKTLISIEKVLSNLGIEENIPFIGWIFNREFALKNKKLIDSFLMASKDSKHILDTSNEEWNRIRNLMKVDNDKVFEALRDDYRKGIIKKFDNMTITNLKKVFDVLYKEGGSKLVGKSKSLDDKTFWKINN